MGICCVTQGTQTGPVWQAEGWDGEEDGREVREGGDKGVPMADSCWCMTENHNILESKYLSIIFFNENKNVIGFFLCVCVCV